MQEQLEQIHHSLQGFVLVGRERLVRRLIHGRNRIEPSLLTANLTAKTPVIRVTRRVKSEYNGTTTARFELGLQLTPNKLFLVADRIGRGTAWVDALSRWRGRDGNDPSLDIAKDAEHRF